MRISDWSSDVCSSDLSRVYQILIGDLVDTERRRVEGGGDAKRQPRAQPPILITDDVAPDAADMVVIVDEARHHGTAAEVAPRRLRGHRDAAARPDTGDTLDLLQNIRNRTDPVSARHHPHASPPHARARTRSSKAVFNTVHL